MLRPSSFGLSACLGASVIGIILAACTSFGAAGGNGDADAEVDAAAPVPLGDGAVVLADGAVVPGEASTGVDGGRADAAAGCKLPAGTGAPSQPVNLTVGDAVAAHDPSTGTLYVAGTEDCLSDGMRRTAVYRVPSGGTGTRIACLGEALEAPLVIDADATGVVIGTRYLVGGLFSARLYRLEPGGAAKSPPTSVNPSGKSTFPSAVKRAGTNDVWAYYSPAPQVTAFASATLKVEPGGFTVALGEVPIVALSGGPSGIATLEVDLSASALGVRAGRWNLVGAQISRDANDTPARFLPSNAPSQAPSYPLGVLHAAANELAAGFTFGAQAFATYVGPRGTAPFTVGPLGAATARAPVALLCDGSLVVGHSELGGNRGRITRFPSPTSAATDPAFAPDLAAPPSQIFPDRDGTLLVFASAGQGSTIVRVR